MAYIVLGASCAVHIPLETQIPAISFLKEEFLHHLSQEAGSAATVGVIDVVDELNCPSRAVLLQDKRLYADGDTLYCLDGASMVRIHLTEEQFNLTVDHKTNGGLLALVMQALLNWYMPKYGLVFLHAAAFRYQGKVYAIHGFGGAGKTEVMVEALQRGAGYIADDLAIFDQDGRIYPYVRRIAFHDYYFSDEQLERFGLDRRRYHIMRRCEKMPGRLPQYLFQRYRGRYKVIVDPNKVSANSGNIQNDECLYVDNNYWLDSSDMTEFKPINKEDYKRKMTFCMQNEFRAYVDFGGYFSLVYVFWPELQTIHDNILEKALNSISIMGLSIDAGHFKELANLIRVI